MQILLWFAIISGVTSLKFLAYSPRFAKSHVNFIAKLSESLVKAGHEVVTLSEIVDSSIGPGTNQTRLIEIGQSATNKALEEYMSSEGARDFWNEQPLWRTLIKWMDNQRLYAEQCRDVILDEKLIAKLRAENFDAAFSESAHMCAFALFLLVGIDKYAVADSVAVNDGQFFYTHVPTNPAYVPTRFGGGAGDRMTFTERALNTFTLVLGTHYYYRFLAIFNGVLREKRPELPAVEELMARNSLVFVNADPLIDFPRPSAARIIDIGGIVVSEPPKPLNETWSSILSLRPRTVFISFGSFTKAHLMPTQYKKTVLEMIRSFPDVTFIWKYEKPEHRISGGIGNLIESTWVPQRDLLHDPRLSAFITHCGQGSITEAIDAGVPLIVVPVRGDQMRNAAIAVRVGLGVRAELSSAESLQQALSTIFSKDSFRKRAREVREILNDRPFAMDEIFVKNMEFLATHGPLRQLDHHGRQLSFIQYYLIDIISVFLCIKFIAVIVMIMIIRSLSRRVEQIVHDLLKRKLA